MEELTSETKNYILKSLAKYIKIIIYTAKEVDIEKLEGIVKSYKDDNIRYEIVKSSSKNGVYISHINSIKQDIILEKFFKNFINICKVIYVSSQSEKDGTENKYVSKVINISEKDTDKFVKNLRENSDDFNTLEEEAFDNNINIDRFIYKIDLTNPPSSFYSKCINVVKNNKSIDETSEYFLKFFYTLFDVPTDFFDFWYIKLDKNDDNVKKIQNLIGYSGDITYNEDNNIKKILENNPYLEDYEKVSGISFDNSETETSKNTGDSDISNTTILNEFKNKYSKVKIEDILNDDKIENNFPDWKSTAVKVSCLSSLSDTNYLVKFINTYTGNISKGLKDAISGDSVKVPYRVDHSTAKFAQFILNHSKPTNKNDSDTKNILDFFHKFVEKIMLYYKNKDNLDNFFEKLKGKEVAKNLESFLNFFIFVVIPEKIAQSIYKYSKNDLDDLGIDVVVGFTEDKDIIESLIYKIMFYLRYDEIIKNLVDFIKTNKVNIDIENITNISDIIQIDNNLNFHLVKTTNNITEKGT